MQTPFSSKKSILLLAFALFLLGIACMIYFKAWWPYSLLVLGLPLAIKQFLEKRCWDSLFTLIVFVGFFSLIKFDIPWKILLNVFFVVSAVYLLCREWLEGHFSIKSEKKENKK